MKFSYFYLFLFSSLFVDCKLRSDTKKTKILIQGNSSVGTGASLWVKKKLLEEIKENLKRYLICDDYEIVTSVKDLKNEKIMKKELNRKYVLDAGVQINHEEFNIFFSVDGEKTLQLIATSDVNNPNNFYKYLQEGIGRKEKDEFLLQIVNKLLDLIKNIK